MTDRAQCPFCMSHPRLKASGEMYAHTAGRFRKSCPGSGHTKEQAKAIKAGEVPAKSETRPEDIF